MPTPTTQPVSGIGRSGGSDVDIPHDSSPGAAWLKLDARVAARVLSAKEKLAAASAERASGVERLVFDLVHVCDALTALLRDVSDRALEDDTVTTLWFSCIRSVYEWVLCVLDYEEAVVTGEGDDGDAALRESSDFIPPLVFATIRSWEGAPLIPLGHLYELYAELVQLNANWRERSPHAGAVPERREP